MEKGFDRAAFAAYLEKSFMGFNNPFLRTLVDNVIDYGLEHKTVSKDQFVYWLSDMIPELEFGEAAMFVDDEYLTAYGLQEKKKRLALSSIKDGADAVFLPGKIHGCEDQLYIIYFNANANDGKGCFEIEIIDYEQILKLYDEVDGNSDEFFGILPDWFHGEWYYCNTDHECFQEYLEDYPKADFICGRDGGSDEEMMFLVNWAKERAAVCNGTSA